MAKIEEVDDLDVPPRVVLPDEKKEAVEVKEEVPSEELDSEEIPIETLLPSLARREPSPLPMNPPIESELEEDEEEVDEAQSDDETQKQPTSGKDDEARDVVKEENLYENESSGGNASSLSQSSVAYVPEVDNELGKFRLLVQGADTTDDYLGGSLPFDMALMKIETPEDRSIARQDAEACLEAANLFGRNSHLASEFREILKCDVMVSRASQGFLQKILVTNIVQQFTDKNVSRRERVISGDSKPGFLGGLGRGSQNSDSRNYEHGY